MTREEEPGSVFEGKIDPDKVGVSGHSLGGYTAMGLAGGWDSWLDARIRAALLFSPYTDPYLVNPDPGKINVPVMYQGGTADVLITPSIKKAGGAYDRSNPPKYFLEIRQAGHMAWSNTVCKGYDTASQRLASENRGRVIDAYGIAFLDRYLNNTSRTGTLAEKDPAVSDYRYQE